MPTTRRQAALQNGSNTANHPDENPNTGKKHHLDSSNNSQPRKKARKSQKKEKDSEPKGVSFARKPESESPWMPGTIERGHIYFFYRPKVQVEEVRSLDDVRNFQMLLVPRPPEFSTCTKSEPVRDVNTKQEAEESDMQLIAPGEDAVPASEPLDEPKKRYRLIVVGKKQLPDPSKGGAGRGRKETFWATVTKVGDDLDALEKGLGEKTYETKTRGTRHEEPARLVGRGGYAIVNNDPRAPSQRETHLGYHISHPTEMGEVQETLGIFPASSFVLQVKNPLAPATGPMQSGGKGAEYPAHIMDTVFGQGSKGRESYGLKFSSCDTTELLDYDGAQLLLIAARGGEDGLEISLGGGRGKKLSQKEKKESNEPVANVFKELGIDNDSFPADAIKGEWI